MTRPNQFLSPEGDLEDYFVDEYWLIDQYVGDELWVWGRNDQAGINVGGLGTNDSITRNTPVTTFAGGTNWKQVDSGGYWTTAIKTDGTLWTWGYGGLGRLGNAQITNRFTPVTTFAGGTNWKQVGAGWFSVAAIKTDGTLWTWGYGRFGRLGNGATTGNISTPITTFAGGTNWKQVSSAGNGMVAAIKTDGTLWTWGRGSYGCLGNANNTDRSTPVTTFAGGTNWNKLSGSVPTGTFCYVMAIKTDGTLWGWGSAGSGQLGNNNSTESAVPVTTFAGGTNWKQVSSGWQHTAAIKTDGTLWVWGNCSYGMLGNGQTTGNRFTPVTTFAGGTNWKDVNCGLNYTAAIKTDGTLWTWGRNITSELGINNTTNISTPVTTFAGGTNWKQVSCARHTVAVFSGTTPDLPIS